jgi:hypothetical protein
MQCGLGTHVRPAQAASACCLLLRRTRPCQRGCVGSPGSLGRAPLPTYQMAGLAIHNKSPAACANKCTHIQGVMMIHCWCLGVITAYELAGPAIRSKSPAACANAQTDAGLMLHKMFDSLVGAHHQHVSWLVRPYAIKALQHAQTNAHTYKGFVEYNVSSLVSLVLSPTCQLAGPAIRSKSPATSANKRTTYRV